MIHIKNPNLAPQSGTPEPVIQHIFSDLLDMFNFFLLVGFFCKKAQMEDPGICCILINKYIDNN